MRKPFPDTFVLTIGQESSTFTGPITTVMADMNKRIIERFPGGKFLKRASIGLRGAYFRCDSNSKPVEKIATFAPVAR